MGFEPTRAEHNGLAVHRLNHSATLSLYTHCRVSVRMMMLHSSSVLVLSQLHLLLGTHYMLMLLDH